MLRLILASCACFVFCGAHFAFGESADSPVQPSTQPAALPADSPTSQPRSLPTTQEATTQPATTQPVVPTENDTTDIVEQDSGLAVPIKNIPSLKIITSPAVGTNREPRPPRYVHTVANRAEELGLEGLQQIDWLDIGIDHRSRFEYRDDYYRADLESGYRFFMRSRGYVGVRKVLDPFRFAIEFQDSRRFGDPLGGGGIDEADILQLYGELFFKDVAGEGYPLSIRAGRMSFDAIDRRLVARNRFRNTTNAFDGVAASLGSRQSNWEITGFLTSPVEIEPYSPDQADDDNWFFGLTGYWRGWSPYFILEPYYFFLDQNESSSLSDSSDQRIHTIGMHGFGLVGDTGLDYDFDVAFQFGDNEGLTQRAFAAHGEIGYTLDLPAEPRISFLIDYASGDRDPNDGTNQRFDRLFGASHSMYGYSDLFVWENVIIPAVHVSSRPTKRVRLDAFYRAYWLASDTDAWVTTGLRDPSGSSGSFIGQEIDLRAVYQINRNLALELGYAYFVPGSFTENTSTPAPDSDFFYLQLSLRL